MSIACIIPTIQGVWISHMLWVVLWCIRHPLRDAVLSRFDTCLLLTPWLDASLWCTGLGGGAPQVADFEAALAAATSTSLTGHLVLASCSYSGLVDQLKCLAATQAAKAGK